MIKTFGKELKFEAKGPLEIGTAHALQTRRISTHAARELVIRSKALVDDETDISLARAVDEKEGYANLELDDLNLSSDGSVDSAEEDDGSELEVDQKLTQVSEFLLNSQAYASLKSRLLDFAHRPYEMRISMAIGDTVVGQSGDILCPDSLRLITRETSWVPTHLLTFEGLNTLLDRFKGAVEDRIGEVELVAIGSEDSCITRRNLPSALDNTPWYLAARRRTS
jgi:hypothetical protein